MKITENTTKVRAVVCPNCKDKIFSRAHHDFHWCSCGDTAVDGGFEYVRMCFKSCQMPPEQVDLVVNASRQELYDDWNLGRNEFGIISPLTPSSKKGKITVKTKKTRKKL